MKVRFAGSSNWIEGSDIKVAAGYIDGDGNRRDCSADDLAMFRIPTDPDLVLDDDFSALGSEDAYHAIGFHKSQLVEHAGDGRHVPPFVAHNAHTTHGHSGCPVFFNRRLVGIHVGLFSKSMRYLPTREEGELAFLNSAVLV
ncbi:hypothetical protein [Luteimonas sp. SDU82]|uniref:hypothetical protein n=1 Tax=Luteimonas sp. SDU82 TaxID=3422592 RepID=UPI003EBDF236